MATEGSSWWPRGRGSAPHQLPVLASLDCFEHKPLGGSDPSSHCRWEGRSVHLGTVPQVFPLDFCFELSRQSCVRDRAGTLVELLHPLLTGCCHSAQGCSPCPGTAGEMSPFQIRPLGHSPWLSWLNTSMHLSSVTGNPLSPSPSQNRPQHIFYSIWVWTLGTGKSLRAI